MNILVFANYSPYTEYTFLLLIMSIFQIQIIVANEDKLGRELIFLLMIKRFFEIS